MTTEDRARREHFRQVARAMREADEAGICYITVDGWCSTHSTGEGPVYCSPEPL